MPVVCFPPAAGLGMLDQRPVPGPQVYCAKMPKLDARKLLVICVPGVVGIPPQFLQEIIVYHVNPSHLGAIPLNMVRHPSPFPAVEQ